MDNTKFSTKDLGMAATLLTLHFRMTGTYYQYEGGRQYPTGYFEFDKTQQLDAAVSDYIQEKLAVEPRALLANVRSLKAAASNFSKNPTMQAENIAK